jgi:23S rRNA (uracil1939-C5)-methyltransferase
MAFVEIGQRRKHLYWLDGKPKLGDAELRPWFETYGADGSAIPLYGPVGGFSQSGFQANRVLVETVCELAKQSGIKNWLELFSGNGNFALALASRGAKVEAIEQDALAVQGLERSLQEIQAPWRDDVKVSRLDIYLKTSTLPSIQDRGLLVDPPRAGLREVLQHMKQGWMPKALLYVSCFSESFIEDTKTLSNLGYSAQVVLGVDQFPFTPHAEWVALFTN